MRQVNYVQSESKNLTVFAIGSALVIHLEGKSYFINNPGTQPPPGVEFKTVPFDEKRGSVDDLLAEVEKILLIQQYNELKRHLQTLIIKSPEFKECSRKLNLLRRKFDLK